MLKLYIIVGSKMNKGSCLRAFTRTLRCLIIRKDNFLGQLVLIGYRTDYTCGQYNCTIIELMKCKYQ